MNTAMLTNREFIAVYHNRFRAPGLASAATEQLLTCPLCGIPNFSARGLSAHHCRATPERTRLTPDQLQLARARAREASTTRLS